MVSLSVKIILRYLILFLVSILLVGCDDFYSESLVLESGDLPSLFKGKKINKTVASNYLVNQALVNFRIWPSEKVMHKNNKGFTRTGPYQFGVFVQGKGKEYSKITIHKVVFDYFPDSHKRNVFDEKKTEPFKIWNTDQPENKYSGYSYSNNLDINFRLVEKIEVTLDISVFKLEKEVRKTLLYVFVPKYEKEFVPLL